MPLYEYRCEKCGRFESLQKVSDAPHKTCPTCGASVERLISAPAFQFKGSGWYITDYARSGSESKETGSKTETKSAESGSGTSKETSSSTSADSKSSTTSPPKDGAASKAPASAPASTSQ